MLKLYTIFIFSILLYTCTTPSSDTTETSIDDVNQLKVYNDSVGMMWDSIRIDDSIKITNINRLLQEISYCQHYDESLYSSLVKESLWLEKNRLQQNTLNNTAIDVFDRKMTSVITNLKKLIDTTPEVSRHMIVETLMTEIDASETSGVIRYRAQYDRYVQLYNQIRLNYTQQSNDSYPKQYSGFSILP